MNDDILKGKWKQLMGSVKSQWGDLTGDDLTSIAGQRDKLEGKLQERYGWSREEAHKRVDEWYKSSRDLDL